MKIEPRNAARALAEAGKFRAILLYGEDSGLIRERASGAARLVGGSVDDPFRVALLDRSAQDRLEEEASALSLIGGRRVVWLRDADDSLLTPLKGALDHDSDTLILIEAPGLASKSKLCALAEARKDVAAIGCYPEEGRALSHTVSEALAGEDIAIDRDALAWLTGHLGEDRAGVRGEIGKLALYAGPGGRLDLDAVRDCVGDSGAATLEDAVFAALCGDRQAADQALERALADGANPVAVARAVLSALARLQRVALAVADGAGRAEVMKALRPPVFFKRAAAFNQALDRWNAAALARAERATQEFELACKRSASPDVALCRRHIAALCARPR